MKSCGVGGEPRRKVCHGKSKLNQHRMPNYFTFRLNSRDSEFSSYTIADGEGDVHAWSGSGMIIHREMQITGEANAFIIHFLITFRTSEGYIQATINNTVMIIRYPPNPSNAYPQRDAIHDPLRSAHLEEMPMIVNDIDLPENALNLDGESYSITKGTQKKQRTISLQTERPS